MQNQESGPNPSLLQAVTPLLFLTAMLVLNVVIFKDNASYGPNQIALFMSALVAAGVGLKLGVGWKQTESGIMRSIQASMPAIMILFCIGALAGTWLISGIIPTMIYYGVDLLNPKLFLVSASLICAVISIATGSSWSTIATVGVALLGIGEAFGINPAMCAGAIISGSYFGDKMSPLSDTTNLAPAVSGSELFTHIRYMMYTTMPSMVIAQILFLIIGLSFEPTGTSERVLALQTALDSQFNISLWLFVIPAATGFMIYKKMPAIPALLIGALLGGGMAMVIQPEVIKVVAGNSGSFMEDSYHTIIAAMFGDVSLSVQSPDPAIQASLNKLLQAKGMAGMTNTVWLIISAMMFGGAMEATGLLKRITEAILSLVTSSASLVASTVASCIFFNITAADQFLAIIVPGRMYKDVYKKHNLAPEHLSRTLEDAATVTSVLIPWNTCGAAQAAALNVSTWAYAPYCFFNIISPFMSVFYTVFKIKMAYLKGEEETVESAA